MCVSFTTPVIVYGRVAVTAGEVSVTIGGVVSVANVQEVSNGCPSASNPAARKVWRPSGTPDASTQIAWALGVHGSWGITAPSMYVVRDVQFSPLTLTKSTQTGPGRNTTTFPS